MDTEVEYPTAAQREQQFPPMHTLTRPRVDTATAAHYLGRRPQTLRVWAMRGNGPIRPARIGGRLAWSVNEIRHLLMEEQGSPPAPPNEERRADPACCGANQQVKSRVTDEGALASTASPAGSSSHDETQEV